MAVSNTYQAIATQTVSGVLTTQMTFNSISGSYTDLVLIANGMNGVATQNLEMRINNDSGSNYSRTAMWGTGTAAFSGRTTSATQVRLDVYGYWNTTTPATTIVNFLNYSNTTTYKTFLARANSATTGVDAGVGLWRSTAAITRVDLYPTVASGDYFAAGSTFTLYGIAAA
jgi:hypothetical protein